MHPARENPAQAAPAETRHRFRPSAHTQDLGIQHQDMSEDLSVLAQCRVPRGHARVAARRFLPRYVRARPRRQTKNDSLEFITREHIRRVAYREAPFDRNSLRPKDSTRLK